MAIVKEIQISDASGKRHPTEVKAVIRVFGSAEHAPILQIDTFGSKDRQNLGKLNQTIQFAEPAARELFAVMKSAFNFE